MSGNNQHGSGPTALHEAPGDGRQASARTEEVLVVVGSGLLLISAFCLCAQALQADEAAPRVHKVSLTRQAPPEEIAIHMFSTGAQLQRVSTQPKGVKSEKALAGEFHVGLEGKATVKIVLDESKGTGRGLDSLIVDGNRNGDLSDDPRHKFARKGFLRRLFGGDDVKIAKHVKVTVPYERSEQLYHVNIEVRIFDGRFAYAEIIPDMIAVGELRLGAKPIKIALADANVNGLFGDMTRTQKADIALHPEGIQHIRPGDHLLIDLDGDGRMKGPPWYRPAGREDFLLCKLAEIRGKYYSLAVKDDGTEATFTATDPPVGKLRLPKGKIQGWVVGPEAVLSLADAKDGLITGPVGEYYVYFYNYAFQAGNRKKALVTAYAFTGPTRPFTIEKGLTTDLAIGQPLAPKVTAQKSGEKVHFSFDLSGPHGERIVGVQIDGSRPPAPKFTIHDAKGKQVLSGKFRYG